MKTTLFKIVFFLSLLPGMVMASNDFNGKHTKEKKIKKEYSVNANATLSIDNRYGNLDITTWDENRVLIEVIVKTNGNDEEAVQKRLDEINIEFSNSSNGVSARTRFHEEDRSWWKQIFSSSGNVNIEVNYIVKAPVTNNMDLENDYGGIFLDKLQGNAKIDCDYGKIDIGELRGRSNYINFDYTRNSTIDFVTNAEINADYSEFEVLEAEEIKLNADYTQSSFVKVERLEFSCDYGALKIGKVRQLTGDGDYLSTKIDRIFTSANLNMDYGSLSIDKIIKGTREINIDTDYTGVKIGYDREMSFNFDVKTSYGSVNGLDDLNVMKSNKGNTSREVSGSYGSGSGAKFNIKTSYGSVSFNKE